MHKLWPILGMLAVLLLAGCRQATTRMPTPTATPAQPVVPQPTAAAKVDYCLSCHTDKEQLISTAKPEEPVESESKGVG